MRGEEEGWQRERGGGGEIEREVWREEEGEKVER